MESSSSASGPGALLVFAPNWLGDAVMATPALRALRAWRPRGRMVVAGRPAICQVLEGLPCIDSLVPLAKRPGPAGMLRDAARLRRERPDACVVLPHSFRAALLARASGARQRIGYARDARGRLLTHPVSLPSENGKRQIIYTAHEYLRLCEGLGCVDDGKGLELHAPAAECEALAPLLEGEGPLVGIAPGAAFGPSKRWHPERFAAAADALHARNGARLVLITGPGEEHTRDAVLAAAQAPILHALPGPPSIARLKALVSRLDLLITNDSGPRHLAVAFGVPVVCVMGSTSPAYTESPWEKGEVIRLDVDCGPCQKPHCTTDHRCMTRIAPERVAAAAAKWLAR